MMKVLIATGGTGGHVHPALATARELTRRGCAVVLAGAFGAAEQKVRDEGFACVPIAPRGFVSKGFLRKAEAVGAMAVALVRCIGIVRRVKPDVVLGFGGYSSFPVAAAGVLTGVRTMVHEQNAMPGQANRLLGRFVQRVALGFRDAAAFFPDGKTVWTGNPLRPFDAAVPRAQACTRFGLDPERCTVFVFGGSQGAHAINTNIPGVLADAPPGLAVQVIHITGKNALAAVTERYRALGVKAFVRDHTDEMPLAYAAADLVVGRAGAGTVTELGFLGVPAVLVPYPGAGDHQKYNARVLERLGTASIIEEKSLRQDILRDKIFSHLRRDPDGSARARNREKLKDDFVGDGAGRLCDEVLRLAHD